MLASGDLANSSYFDKSTVKTFSQTLKSLNLAQVQGGSIQLEQADALDVLKKPHPQAQQALNQATTFSEKVLKDFELIKA